jgi:hypothetical protein
MTIGIVWVARWAARAAGVPHVTIASGLRRTNSLARVLKWLNLPIGE